MSLEEWTTEGKMVSFLRCPKESAVREISHLALLYSPTKSLTLAPGYLDLETRVTRDELKLVV